MDVDKLVKLMATLAIFPGCSQKPKTDDEHNGKSSLFWIKGC